MERQPPALLEQRACVGDVAESQACVGAAQQRFSGGAAADRRQAREIVRHRAHFQRPVALARPHERQMFDFELRRVVELIRPGEQRFAIDADGVGTAGLERKIDAR